MIAANLVANQIGLWWATLTCTTAAALCVSCAANGTSWQRWPRILLATSVAVIACSYWIDLLDANFDTADMRRGAGLVLWPALAWTAWTEARHSRRTTTAVRDLFGDDGQ